MAEKKIYSARAVFDGMKKTFHQYLEAQYHIWDEGLIDSRTALLRAEGVTYQEPHIEATPYYVAGPAYAELLIPDAAKNVLLKASQLRATGIPERPYLHQANAVEAFLGIPGKQVIVATGTGSGKTESFLMPILGSLADESANRPESWRKSGCRALLLYPMNALVNDQVSRLRRLLSQGEVADKLRGGRPHCATFGMYTSRTPYAGTANAAKNRQRVAALVESAFLSLPDAARERLKKEGKWPAKDLKAFIESGFRTGPADAEMLTRSEMQTRCPDLLVTNYSMLEYMLLRPIEQPIFDQTAAWLATDKRNVFTVVLDEAHMYRGSGGAEVAYLLRRLHARLGIPRDRVRYILTSASLGTTNEAAARMKEFASDLTGQTSSAPEFVLITGEKLKKSGERVATASEAKALEAYDFAELHELPHAPAKAIAGFMKLAEQLGTPVRRALSTLPELQDEAYRLLSGFGPASLVANLITAKPSLLREIGVLTFPSTNHSGLAMEALLALMSFAKESDTGKVFTPVRSHLFFRGLSGIHACVNPTCKGVQGRKPGILGKLHGTPTWSCECGSRVYEVLTHRDCGAAFLRGYVHDQFGDFLWHEPSRGLRGNGGLMEAHFLVETQRRATSAHGRLEGASVWLHKATGQLLPQLPEHVDAAGFIELLRPDHPVRIKGKSVLSFDRECPVCTREWQSGSTKIMDLATKGEAPFAQLIKTQVQLQPATIDKVSQSPNEGRKSLLFSDGRQKAARLARDIPREIESDVFRQLLLMSIMEMRSVAREPTMGKSLYTAMLHVLSKHSILLFDGSDREMLQSHVNDYRRYYEGDLVAALSEHDSAAPARFSSLLLRHLGSPFYSVNALTLAYLVPTDRAMRKLGDAIPGVAVESLRRIVIAWMQSMAGAYAVDGGLAQGVRKNAAGYPVTKGATDTGGLKRRQIDFLRDRIANIDQIFKALAETFCEEQQGTPGMFLIPSKIKLHVPGPTEPWSQCGSCATVFPTDWWGHCAICLSQSVVPVLPGETDYLRARKAFFRDPVVEAMEGAVEPFNLTVEEHTAQLSHRDADVPTTTTEEFERRFRDILVTKNDTSIDVLSSTTTMEVGIDIGSLVAVGLRNMPPQRQNYQQRAGRAGRRGSAISTVVTYAQNGPHDSHYFANPAPIIAGEPTLPGVDTGNPRIIERHIRAQIIQAFFHSNIGGETTSPDIFSVLGDTMAFYSGAGPLSFSSLAKWIHSSSDAEACIQAMALWVPKDFGKSIRDVADEFLAKLEKLRPAEVDNLDPDEQKLIEFLFGREFLPAYAFPRDLCALQIERLEFQGGARRVRTIQRPQQGLSVALSEYAPGRLVVVDKKTYRIGTVSANSAPSAVDRAERLFEDRRHYVHCSDCEFTLGIRAASVAGEACPLCQSGSLIASTVIEPQVVYPEGGTDVDEFDDEQVFTSATSAQLSLPDNHQGFAWMPLGATAKMATSRAQQLVMVNKGEESDGAYQGFLICNKCGKTAQDGDQLGPHARDYLISGKSIDKCKGEFERAYLGYGFASDVLMIRLPLVTPLRFDPVQPAEREPMAAGLQSLAEAIVLGISRELDIDLREVNAGYRFLKQGAENFADIFVYDTLSGGAGYALAAGQVIESVLDRAAHLLTGCTCPTSCEKCLRHYGNRFHHELLDRQLATDLLSFFRHGAIPDLASVEQQREMLRPIKEMLILAGWKSHGATASQSVALEKAGRVIRLFTYPSLVHPRHFGYEDQQDCFALSPYELTRDLPGVFAEIS